MVSLKFNKRIRSRFWN